MAAIQQIEGRSIHQIQSGQVINDGLNSAVKELVENSLDANASSIEVRFKNWGLDAIEIVDNGDGISPENYESIALKHYTSKLRSYSDLESVTTFGFRGEALSSLCALSDLQVTTATVSEAPKGTKLDFEMSGKLKSKGVVAASKGTTVVVGNLFKSLPVRRKELERNFKREYTKVLGILQAYASISVGVKFSVFNQPPKGKKTPVFATKGNGTTRENIANVFGAKTLTALVPLNLEFEMLPTQKGSFAKTLGRHTESRQVKVIGHISKPVVGEGRNAPDRQMFFVNGRPCLLPQISRAINEVYKGFNVTQSPFIFADIKLDTNAYDVNVSPDKRTILLHDQTDLLENLKKSLTELFDKHDQTVPAATPQTQRQSSFKQSTLNRNTSSISSHASTPKSVPSLQPQKSFESAQDSDSLPSSPIRRRASVTRRLSQEERSGETGTDVGVDEYPAFQSLVQKIRDNRNENTNRPFKPPTFQRNFSLTTTADQFSEDAVTEDATIPSTDEPEEEPIPFASSQNLPIQRGFRSPRKPSGPATITIGDRVTVTRGSLSQEPSPKRRKVMVGGTNKDWQSRDKSTIGVFNKFAAPGSQPQESAEDDDDNEDETEDEDGFVLVAEADIKEEEQSQGLSELAPEVHRHPNVRSEGFGEEVTSSAFRIDEDEAQVEEEEGDDEQVEELRTIREASSGPLLSRQAENRRQKLLREVEQDSTTSSDDFAAIFSRRLVGSPKTSTKNLVRTAACSLNDIRRSSSAILSLPPSAEPIASTAITDALTQNDAAAEERLSLTISKADFLNMRIKGQFNKGFILATRDNDLFIIDQHASDEKYNFETLQQTTIVQNQPLVVPKMLDLMAMDELAVSENLDLLKKNGFVIEVDTEQPTGQRCKLISLPMSKETVFGFKDLEELIHLIHQHPGSTTLRCSKVRSMFAMRACRKSVMVGKALPIKAMEKIVRHMGELDKPWNCPHGRPTMRHLAELRSVGSWCEDDLVRSCESLQWDGEGWKDIVESYGSQVIDE